MRATFGRSASSEHIQICRRKRGKDGRRAGGGDDGDIQSVSEKIATAKMRLEAVAAERGARWQDGMIPLAIEDAAPKLSRQLGISHVSC